MENDEKFDEKQFKEPVNTSKLLDNFMWIISPQTMVERKAAELMIQGTLYAKKKLYDEPMDEARKEGFANGVRKGTVETAKKFAKRMAENDNLKIGVFALAVYVANKDNDISEEERATIERYLGRPDSRINKTVRDEFKNIYENVPSFPEIRDKYLDEFSREDLEETDVFMMDVINADNIVAEEEKSFLSRQWKPYLRQRGIDV